MLVVDASIAFDGAIDDEVYTRLRSHGPVGPPLLWSETTSALRQAAWRGLLDQREASAALFAFLSGPIELHRPDELHREAFVVAEEMGWAKTYDAEYVALARLLDCSLLTKSARLKSGASTVAEIIGPAEL
jgi:predicted nucleic acid-binding protein